MVIDIVLMLKMNRCVTTTIVRILHSEKNSIMTVKYKLVYVAKLIVVYRIGRLCEGAHEISGIKAPLFSVGGWWDVWSDNGVRVGGVGWGGVVGCVVCW